MAEITRFIAVSKVEERTKDKEVEKAEVVGFIDQETMITRLKATSRQAQINEERKKKWIQNQSFRAFGTIKDRMENK